ncbi:DUF4911 domain-containing protein [Thermosipho ferrireducens]|uniref:DUF4911 domain-containing protein n=1 Tax=Thermosipho ferrireducens TaxID=2571116 RepID=A0ABX7S6S4_9BACT|nr:DUF4911 domain-containing protein [Thermosipho ferrireducens]QTA37598.1 DUF4911 domain-containing protein [Thermosipho ferrireducens]
MEYDILVKISREDVHFLSYVLETEDNMMNIRKYENGILRIIVPDAFKNEVLKLLESMKKHIKLEVVDVKKNNGSAD